MKPCFLVGLVAFAVMLVDSSALGNYTGLSVKLYTSVNIGGAQRWVYRVYAECSNMNDYVTGVTGVGTTGGLKIENTNAQRTGPGSGFLNIGGNRAPTQAAINSNPSLQWDTFATIGVAIADQGSGSPPSVDETTYQGPSFISGIQLVSNSVTWQVPGPVEQGRVGHWPNKRVLLMQLTVMAGENVRGSVTVFGYNFNGDAFNAPNQMFDSTPQVVSVPPVIVNTLSHQYFYSQFVNQTVISDALTFPCNAGECNGPGFTASIGEGDFIIIRFEAPPGKRFVLLRASTGTQYFFFNAIWQTDVGDTAPLVPQPASFTFENLLGSAPVNTVNRNYVGNNGQLIVTDNEFTFSTTVSFTAVQVKFAVSQNLMHLMRTYHAVSSTATPSFGSYLVVNGQASDVVVMRVAEPCAADITGNFNVNVNDLLSVINSWGNCASPCPPHCSADIAPAGGDCRVNVDDLLAVINGWGACP